MWRNVIAMFMRACLLLLDGDLGSAASPRKPGSERVRSSYGQARRDLPAPKERLPPLRPDSRKGQAVFGGSAPHPSRGSRRVASPVAPSSNGPARLRRTAFAAAFQKSFLRLLEERIPSISRYFATVRRAIWMPSRLARSSTICWSDSGLPLSSSSMIFLMACLTLSLAMSSSAMRRIEELKKYLSSNSPCGVWTYLLVVTRLMVDSCIPTVSATSLRIIGLR